MEWYDMECDLQRIKVPGGWLVRTGMYSDSAMAMCFYPDPEHKWQ